VEALEGWRSHFAFAKKIKMAIGHVTKVGGGDVDITHLNFLLRFCCFIFLLIGWLADRPDQWG
jgi:hypothetical protein